MVKSLIAGVALAACVTAVQTAEAGHRYFYRPSCAGPVQGGWYGQRPVGNYYTPTAPSTVQAVPQAPIAGPPVAQGPGQVIQRFSEEPGAAPGPGPAAAPAPIYQPAAPAYQPAPAVRSQSSGSSSGPSRNPVERRLRPGRGWQR